MELESRVRNTFPWRVAVQEKKKTSEMGNCSNMTLLQMFHSPGQVSLYFPANSSSIFLGSIYPPSQSFKSRVTDEGK